MTSNHHALYDLGYTRATMAGTKGCEPARGSESQKAGRSSDCSLQLDCMKAESLVIANQHVAVNTFPGLVHTARHTTKAGNTRSRWANPLGGERREVRGGDRRNWRSQFQQVPHPTSHFSHPNGRQPSKVGLVIGVKS